MDSKLSVYKQFKKDGLNDDDDRLMVDYFVQWTDVPVLCSVVLVILITLQKYNRYEDQSQANSKRP